MTAQILDFAEARAQRGADIAAEAASHAALRLITLLDLQRADQPDGETAAVMSLEATALLGCNVALTCGRAAAANGASEEDAVHQLRVAIDHLRESLSSYQPELEARLRALFQEKAS